MLAPLELDDGTIDSMFAALEAHAPAANAARTLPYLGMARSELSDLCPGRLPFRIVRFADYEAGLVELDRRLGELVASEALLEQTLTAGRARALLRKGIAQR